MALAKAKTGVRATSNAVGTWPDPETFALLDELILRRELFYGKTKAPMYFWRDISNALWLLDVNRSPESCRKRKKSLDAYFLSVRESNGRVGDTTWQFWARMMRIEGHKVEEPVHHVALGEARAEHDNVDLVDDNGDTDGTFGDEQPGGKQHS